MSDSSSVSGVAGRYATALFELAEEQKAIETVESHLASLEAALTASAELREVVASPLLSRTEQGAAMAALCDAMKVGAPTKNLIGLMAEKRRLFALSAVIRGFRERVAKKRGLVTAEVRSATPLTKAQRNKLQKTLNAALGADTTLEVAVDETLIGGLVVKVGSKMIDTSIRSKLAQLQTAMREAGI